MLDVIYEPHQRHFLEKIERIEKMQINLCYVSFILITIHSSILNGLYRTQGIV